MTIFSKNKIIFTIFFLIIIISGTFFRFYQLGRQSYWMDEGYTINAVLSINEKGNTILDSGQNYFCSLYCYPTALLTKIFGDSAFAYRFFSAFLGALFILLIFFITQKIFDNKIALLSSFFIAFSYWQIAWSRQARWYTLFACLFWLAFYFFYQFLNQEKKKKIYLVLATLFSFLAILAHGLGYLLPIIFLAWFIINQVFIKKSFSWSKTFWGIIITVISFLLFALISRRELFSSLFNQINIYYELPYYLSFYLRNYWFFIIFSLIAFSIVNLKYKKEILFLTFIFLAYLLPLSFFTNIVHYRYLFHLTPIFFILSSVAIFSFYENFPQKWQKIFLLFFIILVFFLIGGGVFLPKNTYYLESDNPEFLGTRPHYAYTPQPDWNGAYDFIGKNKNGSDLVISSHPQFNKIFLHEAGYWLAYNYLGLNNKENKIENEKEYYVGARVIPDLATLKSLIEKNHGYIVFDYMSTDGRLSIEMINFIQENTQQIFFKETNSFSQIWVYRF